MVGALRGLKKKTKERSLLRYWKRYIFWGENYGTGEEWGREEGSSSRARWRNGSFTGCSRRSTSQDFNGSAALPSASFYFLLVWGYGIENRLHLVTKAPPRLPLHFTLFLYSSIFKFLVFLISPSPSFLFLFQTNGTFSIKSAFFFSLSVCVFFLKRHCFSQERIIFICRLFMQRTWRAALCIPSTAVSFSTYPSSNREKRQIFFVSSYETRIKRRQEESIRNKSIFFSSEYS